MRESDGARRLPCVPLPERGVLRDAGLWFDVREAIAGILDHTTFGDLAAREREERDARRAMYHI